jgi:hypothetical protein
VPRIERFGFRFAENQRPASSPQNTSIEKLAPSCSSWCRRFESSSSVCKPRGLWADDAQGGPPIESPLRDVSYALRDAVAGARTLYVSSTDHGRMAERDVQVRMAP